MCFFEDEEVDVVEAEEFVVAVTEAEVVDEVVVGS